MLNGVLALHDVQDVERLCRSVLEPFRLRGSLDDFDDALAELIGVCWQLGERYDVARDRQPNFAAYASCILSLRVHDRIRRVRGRTRWSFREGRRDAAPTRSHPHERTGRLPRSYERERPVVLSLDAPVGATRHRGNGEPRPAWNDPGLPTLGDAYSVSGGGDPADSDALIVRLLGERDRFRAEDLAVLGERVPRRAA